MKDDITVLIPAYNAEKTIGGTIDAILKQTYDQKLIKLIISNDGSKDGTLQVLKEYQDKLGNDKIQIIDQQNKGVSVTREVLLKDVKTK
jgi:glycosyltransferase involved in cell wall biosynthesis